MTSNNLTYDQEQIAKDINDQMPSRESKCPMCGKVPDPEDFARNHYPFVWNGLTQCFISEFCNLELAVEFYESESRYFEMASKLLETDIWECKRRYLKDIVDRSVTQISNNSQESTDSLKTKIEKCNLQIEAIERFISIQSRYTDENEINNGLQELRRAMQEPAFDLEEVMPDFITIEFENFMPQTA